MLGASWLPHFTTNVACPRRLLQAVQLEDDIAAREMEPRCRHYQRCPGEKGLETEQHAWLDLQLSMKSHQTNLSQICAAERQPPGEGEYEGKGGSLDAQVHVAEPGGGVHGFQCLQHRVHLPGVCIPWQGRLLYEAGLHQSADCRHLAQRPAVHPDVLPRYQRAIAADGLLSQLPVPAKFRQKDENDVWVTGGGTGGHPGTVLLEDAQLGIILLLGQLSHVIIHQVPCSSVIIDH